MLAGAAMFQTLLSSSTWTLAAVAAIMVIRWYLTMLDGKDSPKVNGNYDFDAPIVGYRHMIPARWQFFRNGPAMIREGYAKHKDGFFKVSGNDLLIVPDKYLTELASMPPEKLSLNVATADAFHRLHTITAVITDHSLQARVLVSRVTPRLGVHVPLIQDQLRKYLPHELPATEMGWTSVNALHLARRMVHRVVATQFVTELAEDEEYLSTTISYSENSFKHHLSLRVFPDWAQPALACVLPAAWSVDRALKRAKRMIIPLMRERRRREQEDPGYQKPVDFLQHLMDGGVEIHDDPETTVQRLMVTYLGSGSGATIAVAQVLFDLCVHPEYVESLRQEALEVLRKEGYTKQALADMKKMDSFLRESQRLSPPRQLGFSGVVRQPLTLHDGTILPEGAHIQMAAYAIGVDPGRVPDAGKFDGLRHYENRKRPGESNLHQYTTTSENNLHFGHGRIVCPGRFFAGQSMKMIVSNILLRYHLRFPGASRQRPPNSSMYDVVYPDWGTCVEFKLREDASECVF